MMGLDVYGQLSLCWRCGMDGRMDQIFSKTGPDARNGMDDATYERPYGVDFMTETEPRCTRLSTQTSVGEKEDAVR